MKLREITKNRSGKGFMEMNNRKAITKPIIQTAVIFAVFTGIETAMVYLDVFTDYNMLLCADILLRIIAGTAALVLLAGYSKRGESKYTVKELFSNRIPKWTWLVLIPLILDIIAPFFKLFTAYAFSTSVIVTLTIVIIQQFATGFLEESLHRALMMNGLILKDETVLNHMDNSGEFIKLSKKNLNGEYSDTLASSSQFNDIFRRIDDAIREMGESLMDGRVEASPIKGVENGCAFCPYDSVCLRSYGDSYRYAEKKNAKEVYDELKGDDTSE